MHLTKFKTQETREEAARELSKRHRVASKAAILEYTQKTLLWKTGRKAWEHLSMEKPWKEFQGTLGGVSGHHHSMRADKGDRRCHYIWDRRGYHRRWGWVQLGVKFGDRAKSPSKVARTPKVPANAKIPRLPRKKVKHSKQQDRWSLSASNASPWLSPLLHSVYSRSSLSYSTRVRASFGFPLGVIKDSDTYGSVTSDHVLIAAE